MAEPQQPQPKKRFRWNLIDLFDFLLWTGAVFAGLTLKASDPVIIGWSLLLIGIIGATTKAISMFVTGAKLILVEALVYFFLAISCGIVVVFCWVNNCDITLAFGTATIVAVIAGIVILRKYLGKESVLVSLLPYFKRYGLGAVSGWLSSFLAIGIFQTYVFQQFFPILLFIAAIAAIGFGALGGGIGGLILGSIWKHTKAPIIGGGVGAILLFLFGIKTLGSLLFCPLMGGC